MKRLRRIVLNAMTVLSLLLCVAILAAWVASYRTDRIIHTFGSTAPSRKSVLRCNVTGGIAQLHVVGPWPSTASPPSWTPTMPLRWVPSGDPDWPVPACSPSGSNEIEQPRHTYYIGPISVHLPGVYVDEQSVLSQRGGSRLPIAWNVGVACWLLVAATGVLPVSRSTAWAARRVMARSRAAAVGRCGNCRYDLTANVTGVCPECGNAIMRAG